jgi:hypothetical protein
VTSFPDPQSVVPPPPGGGTTPPPVSSPDPNVVLLLNLFFGGVGYFLLGQKAKGAVAMVLWVVAGVLTCGWGAGVVGIITAIDGRTQAMKTRGL